jgi:ParB family chromosome partitioning protein
MSKVKRSGLGAGSKTLLPENPFLGDLPIGDITGKPLEVKISDIEKNPYQPRNYFNKDEISKLAESIKQKGIIEPLVVIENDSKYQLIAGHRRLMAAKEAKLEKVPVIIRDAIKDQVDKLELALTENILRQDLNPIEEGEAYERLEREFSRPTLSIAKLVGKDRSTIENTTRLLRLPDEIKTEIRVGRLSASHGKVLLTLENKPELMLQAKNEILSKALSVRETELLCKRLGREKKITDKDPFDGDAAYYEAIEKTLSDALGGLKVKIRYEGKNKKIEVNYHDPKDLEMLFSKLNIKFP